MFLEMYHEEKKKSNTIPSLNRITQRRTNRIAKKRLHSKMIQMSIAKVLTKSSTNSAIRIEFGHDTLSDNLCKLIKRNIAFFKSLSSRQSIVYSLCGIENLGYTLKICRIKDIVQLCNLVNVSTGLYLPPSIWVIFEHITRNHSNNIIIKNDFINLYNGGSLKTFVAEHQQLYTSDKLTKGEFKELVNSTQQTFQQIMFRVKFSKYIPTWQTLIGNINIISMIMRFTNSGDKNSGDKAGRINIVSSVCKVVNGNAVGDVMDFLQYLSDNNADDILPYYVVGGKRIVDASNIWHDQLALAKDTKKLSWECRGYSSNNLHIRFDEVLNSETHYFVTELYTSGELAQEGRIQRHCVYSYVRYCGTGRTSIVSLRKSSNNRVEPLVTIEIDNQQKTIVQCRRKSNMKPTPFEVGLIQKFANIHGLTVNSYAI